MPEVRPSKKFLEDIKKFRSNAAIRKKSAKALTHLENNPLHPGLNLERIVNDPRAWSIRVDRRYRISLEPEESPIRKSGLVGICYSLTFFRS